MDLKIQNKIALVTGSTQGIGFATAKKLCEEGVNVIINGRSKSKVNKAVNSLKKQFPKLDIKGIVANLKDKKGCDKLINKVPHIDILINNLGIFEPKEFEKISEEEWFNMFNVNVMSGVRLSQHYLSSMINQNWGRIIFISSESAIQIPKEMIHYGMSKTAQISISRGIAELTKGTNVTSNSIIVGPSKSEGVMTFFEAIAKQNKQTAQEIEKEFFETARPTSLIKRFADVQESASMIVYTASALSSATNGAILRVDGGVVQSAF
ncbi:SDR family NAD(P)-dependent oxidoreductase [Poseidonibacter ostreae]|uniref:SDR family NAD(P)-dependent oxidoreductase n=1 Tax=Poseidonibacter ostreae TaxID=2654171 RepID=A0ABQ6VHP5_9BACT|nr:SDR family oxidoreductase [Poseidonibacter ostreae]KAB7884473.1 SDR family NAD(P)-dependent oxidoreductase [Poseidonibacter ostreae]KAB7886460.1 SDR family NAD(P)-dependent oxidoreductase [Poseidonibacter ostreae]